MKTPKERFCELPAVVEAHKKWANERPAEVACDYAMLQYVHELTTLEEVMPGPEAYKLQGAKRVLDILINLHRPVLPSGRPPIARQNLKPPE